MVVETPPYLSDADEAGLSEDERKTIVDWLAAHPGSGDIIKGTGGTRKIRFAGRGKGKSGGYRVITSYAHPDMPVFLLALFGKGQTATLTQAECNALFVLVKKLLSSYRKTPVDIRNFGLH